MNHWLTWLPGVRELIRQRDEAAQSRIYAENELRSAQGERNRLWALLEKSLENERQAHRMVVNYSIQSKFGVTPFPDAPSLPKDLAEKQELPPLVSNYVHGDALIRHQENRFAEKLRDRLEHVAATRTS